MPEIKILPSLLAADMGRLEEECLRAQNAGADELHLDIMDGQFAPNISLGTPIVRMARDCLDIPLNVHLMLFRPDLVLQEFINAGSSAILIHIEAECDVPDTLKAIRDAGVQPGITLNPKTPASAIDEVMEQGLVDQVLCMTVNPGFGGQAFMPEILPKLKSLRARYPETDLSVDGGINAETARACAENGNNMFIMGTTLFKADDMEKTMAEIRAIAQAAYTE